MRDDVTIYFIRHGETDWNAEERYQGRADIPLNPRGKVQARRNGVALKALMPGLADADFMASPLGRAQETMRIVRRELGLPIEAYRLDERLVEVDYGTWQGTLLSEVKANEPLTYAERARDPFNWRPPGGETYAEMMERTAAWLASVERDTVVVSHGGVSRSLRGLLFGIDQREVTTLPVPQDRVLVLRAKGMRWL